MKQFSKYFMKTIACLGTIGAAFGSAAAGELHGGWSYHGESGPEHWSELDPAYAACATGRRQSPIDLGASADMAEDGPHMAWRPVALSTENNNGHTVQVTPNSAGHITLDGTRYELAQLHFHHPSEHTVDGAHAPMEIHFVHKAASGALAVIGVLVAEGAENRELAAIWAHMPGEEGGHAERVTVHLPKLLPKDPALWRYRGSLTTPPCSESVEWVVLQSPIEASAQQIEAFATLYEDNHRPVQPADRPVLVSKKK